MTRYNEQELILACAKAMGYEVIGYDENIVQGALCINPETGVFSFYFSPRHNLADCAEMEDHLNVEIHRDLNLVEAIIRTSETHFSAIEYFVDGITLAKNPIIADWLCVDV